MSQLPEKWSAKATPIHWYDFLPWYVGIGVLSGLIYFVETLILQQNISVIGAVRNLLVWLITCPLLLLMFQFVLGKLKGKTYYVGLIICIEVVFLVLGEFVSGSSVAVLELWGIVNLLIMYVVIVHYIRKWLHIKEQPPFGRHGFAVISWLAGLGVAALWVVLLFPLLLGGLVGAFGRDTTASIQSYQLLFETRVNTQAPSLKTIVHDPNEATNLVVKVRFANHNGTIDLAKGAGFNRLYERVTHGNTLKVRYIPLLPDIFVFEGELQLK